MKIILCHIQKIQINKFIVYSFFTTSNYTLSGLICQQYYFNFTLYLQVLEHILIFIYNIFFILFLSLLFL